MKMFLGKVSLALLLVLSLITTASGETINFSVAHRESIVEHTPFVMPESNLLADYEGRIRIYIIEPMSLRWNYNGSSSPYHMAFIDNAFDSEVSMMLFDTLETSVIWTVPAEYADGVFSEYNIMAMAAVYNSEAIQSYSHPPGGYPYFAYYCDAAAAADIVDTWPNRVTENFSHTVLIEEGTATW